MAIRVEGEIYESITGQLFEIGRQLRQPKGYPFNPDQLRKFLQLAVEGKFNGLVAVSTSSARFTLVVDYEHNLKTMVAAGRYDEEVSYNAVKMFAVQGGGIEQYEGRLFFLDRNLPSEEAIEAIEAGSWKPAKIEHLLSFGAKYPEEQLKYNVVCLGSEGITDNGYRCWPFLGRNGKARWLLYSEAKDGWDRRSRFLAVRKIS